MTQNTHEARGFFKTFFDTTTDKRKGIVGVQNALGVGCWDMFLSGSGGFIGLWLVYFLITFGGVSPIMATFIASARLFLDMIWAPVVAVISDNFFKFQLGRKYGRRRFFLIACIPTSIFFILCWVPMSGGLTWLYYLTVFLLFDFFIDIILIPWETLPAEMTEDFTQRNKMGTIRMWAAGLAQPLIAIVPTFFMWLLPAEEGMRASSWALFATAFIWGVIGILFTWFVYISSWEPFLIDEEKRNLILADLDKKEARTAETPLQIIVRNFKNLWLTTRIKTFRQHLILYFSTFGVIDSYSAIFVIFCSIAFLPILTIDPGSAAIILAIPLLLMTFLYAPIGSWLLNHPKIGPQKLYTIGFGIGLLACIWYFLIYAMRGSLSSGAIWALVVAASCMFTIGRNIMGGIPWVVYPMMADVDEVISRDKRAGIYAGAMTFVRKITAAIFTILIGIVLQFASYDQEVSLTQSRVSGFTKSHANLSAEEIYSNVVQAPSQLSKSIYSAIDENEPLETGLIRVLENKEILTQVKTFLSSNETVYAFDAFKNLSNNEDLTKNLSAIVKEGQGKAAAEVKKLVIASDNDSLTKFINTYKVSSANQAMGTFIKDDHLIKFLRSNIQFTSTTGVLEALDSLIANPNKPEIIQSLVKYLKQSNPSIKDNMTIGEFFKDVIISPNLEEKVSDAGYGANLLMILLVGGMFAGALYTAWTFKLNSYTHKVLMDEIERFRKVDLKDDNAIRVARQSVDPETKRIVEELTGLNYDKYAWSGDLVNGDIAVTGTQACCEQQDKPFEDTVNDKQDQIS